MNRAALAAIVCAFAGVAEAQRIASVTLEIVDRTSGEPVAGAIISVAGELLATDEAGASAIVLAPGRYRIIISAPFLRTHTATLVVTGDGTQRFAVDAASQAGEAGGETIEIVDIAPSAPGETRVDAKLARMVPGGGDAGKVVQSLPAVARPPAGSADIVVWGSAPRDTRVFVDGVPVPVLYHLGGYRAAVGNDLVGDIRLTPAAFGPDRGRAIGGVIDIGLDDPANAPAWRAQVDPLDASLAGKTTLGAFTIAAAARHSLLARAVDAVTDPRELAPNAPLPSWTDAQIVVRGAVATNVTLTSWLLGSVDGLQRTLASDDPATEVREDLDRRWVRGQATLRRESERGFAAVTLWGGRDRDSDDFAFGLVPASRTTRAWVGGARGVQQTRIADPITVTVGADLDGEYASIRRAGSLAIPAREGDPQIFGQPPGDDVSADRWTATTLDVAGHLAVDLRWKRLTATLGGRADTWLLGASRLTPRVGATPGIASQRILHTQDPRATVQYALTSAAILRVDAGRYHQARAASDTSAVFGTPTLGVEQAWHLTVGGQYRAARGFAIEAALFSRWLDGLVARDPAITPPLAGSLTQDGRGRVMGAQLTARLVGTRGFSGWLSYALGTSTRVDVPGGRERYFDADQRHGLIAVGGWEHGAWSLGGRIRFATGAPRTGVVGSFIDARSGRYQPIRGEHNGERLPAFFAADVRGERRFRLGPVRTAVYLEIQNLSSRANAEEIIYSADYTVKSYLTSLPLLALAGLRFEQ